MLKQWFQAIALVAACSTASQADWTIKTVTTIKYGKLNTTEYFKDGLRRRDQHSRDGSAVSPYIEVLDLSRYRQILWRADLQQYVVQRTRGRDAIAARPVSLEMVITSRTTDTGERKDFFGRSAKHLISEQTFGNAGMVGSGTSSTRIDGWYIDSPSLPREKRGTAVAILSAGGPTRIKVNQTGPAPAGLAVWEKRWHRTSGANDSLEASEITTEVTELVEAPLENDLFRPPPNFQRVVSFTGESVSPLGDRLRLEWERIEDWFSDILS